MKATLAHQLLRAMHSQEAVLAAVEGAMTQQRQNNPHLAPVLYDSVLARMKRTIAELTDSLAPFYAQRFSETQLEAMVRFFESPAGQALAEQQVALEIEARRLGARWGARIAADVVKQLTDAGIDITSP